MKVRFLITLLAFAVFTACKKSEDKTGPDQDPAGSVSFAPSSTITSELPVMFTNDGMITDQSLIRDFLTRRGNVANFTFETPGSIVIGSYTLKIQDNGALIGPEKHGVWDVVNDSMYVFYDSEAKTPDNRATITDTLNNLVNAYGPLAMCPGFYKQPCPHHERYLVQLQGGKTYVPYVISLVAVRYDKAILGLKVPYTQIGFYSDGMNAVVNKTALLDKLASNKTITYYDEETARDITTERYDTVVTQVLKREMIKQ